VTIDEMTLLAYVDGDLRPSEAEAVEKALATDEELQRQVQALRASRLPYRRAFEAQDLPSMPLELRERVDSWIGLIGKPKTELPANRRRWVGIGAGLAASFAAGLWVPVPMRLNPDSFEDQPWVQAVVRYQALYVRETVDRRTDGPELAGALLAAFAAHGGVRVEVPDLRSAGLAFRRIQRLSVGDAPLIQMEYLPANGKPMSLCVLAAPGNDARLTTRRVEGLSVSTWRRRGLEFAMLADMPIPDVQGLAERVASGELPALYGPHES
jgi:anti-sigma factor RsiW